MLILGDSNGRRRYVAVLELLKAPELSCDIIKIEALHEYMPDTNYYSNGPALMLRTLLFTGGTASDV